MAYLQDTIDPQLLTLRRPTSFENHHAPLQLAPVRQHTVASGDESALQRIADQNDLAYAHAALTPPADVRQASTASSTPIGTEVGMARPKVPFNGHTAPSFRNARSTGSAHDGPQLSTTSDPASCPVLVGAPYNGSHAATHSAIGDSFPRYENDSLRANSFLAYEDGCGFLHDWNSETLLQNAECVVELPPFGMYARELMPANEDSLAQTWWDLLPAVGGSPPRAIPSFEDVEHMARNMQADIQLPTHNSYIASGLAPHNRRRSVPGRIFDMTNDEVGRSSMADSETMYDRRPSKLSARLRRHSDRPGTKPSSLFARRKTDLEFIRETGDGRQPQQQRSSTKGRRSGPLDPSVRENAKRCRRQKGVCIRCKKDRQPCDRNADGPCSRCVVLGSTAKWQQPCTKANFLDIVEAGTCNYISQRAVNHLTLDQKRRIRIDLPETLDLDRLLDRISSLQTSFNVHVRQGNNLLYTLDLGRCYKYLSSIRRSQRDSQRDLRSFIDHEILAVSEWQDCVDRGTLSEGLMACLGTWGNMPSRASYSYAARAESTLQECPTERRMDVEDDGDRDVIIVAAQLSRIVCRKLEVDAYGYVQKILNDWTSTPPNELLKFVRELGLVLLTLRWRVSWWELLGNGGLAPDSAGREAFAFRVNRLCRVLYFYYCMMRRKLPSWSSKRDLHGIWSAYPDTVLPVFEEFPCKESINGFAEWMMKGRQLIEFAGVERRLAGIGLRHARLEEVSPTCG